MTDAPPEPRPHDVYRREFLDRILSLTPLSLLDVGCGDGALLAAVAAAGKTEVVGIEPGPKRALAMDKGLSVRDGTAEALPFTDKSFDVVTFQYVTHHLADMRKSLLEAVRVARRAVLILDGWYDDAIASQRVAREFDEWAKAVDRQTGMVHNPCPRPGELVDIFTKAGLTDIDYACRLVLRPLGIDEIEASARAQLTEAKAGPDAAAGLDGILRAARLHGISDDGALLLKARLSAP